MTGRARRMDAQVTRRCSLLLAGAVLGLLVIDAVVVTWHWPYVRTFLSASRKSLSERNPQHHEALSAVVAHVRTAVPGAGDERIRYVRDWVHRNSIHEIDAEHSRYAFDGAVVMSMLWKTHASDEAPPHLSCGPRTYAMKSILDGLGIESRVVDVFRDHPNGGIYSHTFLEVWSPDSRSWQIEDPDFNISYRRTEGGAPVTVLDLLVHDLESIEPYGPAGSGWDELDIGFLKEYFKAGLYRYGYDGGRSVAIINRERMAPDRRYTTERGAMSIREYLDVFHGHPLVLYE